MVPSFASFLPYCRCFCFYFLVFSLILFLCPSSFDRMFCYRGFEGKNREKKRKAVPRDNCLMQGALTHASQYSDLEASYPISQCTSQLTDRPTNSTAMAQNTRLYWCKRTCALEQAVSCIWPVHEAKHALLSTGGSLELGYLHTRGALFQESMLHQPRVLIVYWVNQLSSVKWWGGETSDWFKDQRIKSTQGLRTMYHAFHMS